MVKINIVCVGKVKEKYFLSGIEEYAKRIGRFADFRIIEVAEENYKNFSDALINQILEKECERMEPNLKGYVIACAIEGQKLNSEKLSKKIENIKSNGEGQITFVIGGSYGLSNKIKEGADMLLSVSDMTFPHTLFRLMLTEQIYRALSIENGIKYHK